MQTQATTGAPDATEYRGKVRSRDRETSWESASRQTNSKTAALQVRIYERLLTVPSTDEELLIHLGGYGHKATRQSVATRRHELELAGWVTTQDADDGSLLKRPTLAGSHALVWRAVRDGEPVVYRDPEPVPVPTLNHAAGMAAARRRAEWELGSGRWAVMLVDAYLHPVESNAALDEEQSE